MRGNHCPALRSKKMKESTSWASKKWFYTLDISATLTHCIKKTWIFHQSKDIYFMVKEMLCSHAELWCIGRKKKRYKSHLMVLCLISLSTAAAMILCSSCFFFFMSLLILPKAEFCNGDAPQDEGLVCRQDVKIHKLQYVRHMLQFMIFFYDFVFLCPDGCLFL